MCEIVIGSSVPESLVKRTGKLGVCFLGSGVITRYFHEWWGAMVWRCNPYEKASST
jgi:hypothetical protein